MSTMIGLTSSGRLYQVGDSLYSNRNVDETNCLAMSREAPLISKTNTDKISYDKNLSTYLRMNT